ncbi:MAG: RNA-binding S4 domain-containing protein [Ruminococcaceae bacterium]|nr:RNA-binding S4 domain-containing protein [Oscillospiraceae bacterium]
MRLDKYLKVSRIIKRRTIAKEACDKGIISVNGKIARASLEIKIGDIIAVGTGDRVFTAEVLSLDENAKKAEALSMYREIAP